MCGEITGLIPLLVELPEGASELAQQGGPTYSQPNATLESFHPLFILFLDFLYGRFRGAG